MDASNRGGKRTKLAVVGGFRKPRDAAAAGSLHASYLICQAIASEGGYSELHLYQEDERFVGRDDLVVPRSPPARVLDKTLLAAGSGQYAAIYAANGEQAYSVPQVLRPPDDWAPVICSVGTAHARSQWQNLLTALASGSVRDTDGFIFKSKAARDLFRSVWNQWNDRLRLEQPFPESSVIIPNGVDVELNRPAPDWRAETRRRLRISPDDLLFLAFSRLSPGSKGDQLALVVRWKEVLERVPRALLALTGARTDRAFLVELRETARAAGVADRVIVLEDPFEVVADARRRLMSAADVFLHLTTGLEETSPLVVHEAMAHGLPVVATDWAGLNEVIQEGETGYLIDTRCAPTFPGVQNAVFGVNDRSLITGASRWIVTDWAKLPTTAAALADPERRSALGRGARRSVEGRTIQTIARRYVEFFQRVSLAAERGWSSQRTFQPLVDLDLVLQAQASGRLTSGDRVRLGHRSRASLLTGGLAQENGAHLEAVFRALEQQPEIELGELALALLHPAGTSGGPAERERAFRTTSRFLVRLLNFGVLQPLHPGSPADPTSPRSHR